MCDPTEKLFSLIDRVRGIYPVELYWISMFVKCVWKHTLRPRVVVLAAVSSLVAPGAVILTPSGAPGRDGFVAVVALWFQVTGFSVYFVFPVNIAEIIGISYICVNMLSWSRVFDVLRNKEFLKLDSWFMMGDSNHQTHDCLHARTL